MKNPPRKIRKRCDCCNRPIEIREDMVLEFNFCSSACTINSGYRFSKPHITPQRMPPEYPKSISTVEKYNEWVNTLGWVPCGEMHYEFVGLDNDEWLSYNDG